MGRRLEAVHALVPVVHILRTLNARISQERKSVRNGRGQHCEKFVVTWHAHRSILDIPMGVEQKRGWGSPNVESAHQLEMRFSINFYVRNSRNCLSSLCQNNFGGSAGSAKSGRELQQSRALTERTADAGMQRYEVSAYARAGHRCQHNLNYWQFGDYLGIGAGAHSKLSFAHRVARLVRYRDPRQYMAQAGQGQPVAQCDEVSRKDLQIGRAHV